MHHREASHVATGTASLASLFRGRETWNGRKSRVSIDDLLAWTYRVELPKARRAADPVLAAPKLAGGAGGMMAMLIELGTRVQVSGWGGGGPAIIGADGVVDSPDPDALRIAAAVAGLDGLVVDLDGVDLLGDAAFAPLTAEERRDAHAAGRARVLGEDGRMRSSLAAFVVSSAVLGRARPVRVVERVSRSEVSAHGQKLWFRTILRSAGEGRPALPVEVDGYDRRRNRPFPGAYRKFRLSPDPAPIVAERIEYQAWRFALEVLCDGLAPVLQRFEPCPNRAPWWPWQPGADAASDSDLSKNERSECGAA